MTLTPKEKADQLFYWYENLLRPFTNQTSNIDFVKSIIKKCASICVDEILQRKLWYNTLVIEKEKEISIDTVEYWQQVKTEIEKL